MKRMIYLVTFLVVSTGKTQEYTTADAAVNIADNTNTFSGCQTITVPAMDDVFINSVRVEVSITHSWVGDLSLRLESPATTQLTFVSRPGRSSVGAGDSSDLDFNFPLVFSDGAVSGVSAEIMGTNIGCVGTDIIGDSATNASCGEPNFRPFPDTGDDSDSPASIGTNFTDFSNEMSAGTWTLCAGDSNNGDTGLLTSWRLGIDTPLPIELQTFSID